MNSHILEGICSISANLQQFFNVYFSYILPVVLGLHLLIKYTDIQYKQSYILVSNVSNLDYIKNVNLLL